MPHSPADNGRSLLTPRLLLLGVLVLTAYRLLVISQPYLTLFYDEAYYYHWSMNPDWGFYSKPPMVGWVIWLTTHLLPVSDFSVKVGAPLLYSATVGWVYLIAKRLGGEKAGVMAGWVFLTAILVGFNSLFITTDAPLLFFWAASFWFFLKAIDTDDWRWWIALGISTGLGMLSKYTMALLPLGLFGLMLIRTEHRPRLATIKPWAAAILAGIVFSPNIIWNAVNGFVTLGHTSEIARLDGSLINLDKLAEFLLGQFLVLGPFWSWVFLSKVFRRTKGSEPKEYIPYVLATFLPLMGVIATQALLSRAFVNWAAPCLIAACVWTGIYMAYNRPQFLTLGIVGQLFMLSLVYHWPTIMDSLDIERSESNDPYRRVLSWPQAGQAVAPWIEKYPDAYLTSASRDLLAYVGFYGDTDRVQIAKWDADELRVDDYYDQLFNLDLHLGDPDQTFLLMNKQPTEPEQLNSFASCLPLDHIQVPVYPTMQRDIYLHLCTHFQGYPELSD